MKRILSILSAVGFFALVSPVAHAAEKPPVAKKDSAKAAKAFASPQKEGTKAVCPVMDEEFVIGKKTLHSEHKGKHVYFCCDGCKSKFDKSPDKFLK